MILKFIQNHRCIVLPAFYLAILAQSCHSFSALPRVSIINVGEEFADDTIVNDFNVDRPEQVLEQRATIVSSLVSQQTNQYQRVKSEPTNETFDSRTTCGTKVDPQREHVAAVTVTAGEHPPTFAMEPHLDSHNITLKPLLTKALTLTLQKYFGYSTFRTGQLQVIQACLEQRDVGVFWSTGSGKSLCYQIPALHTGHIALVVSPLISLMEDQVHKLNFGSNNDGKPLATFLGSGQVDPFVEESAMEGNFPLVYVTPEKLLSENFLDRLAQLHQYKKRLCVIAIDESHCVSEWGHDFRPEYRRIFEVRSHPGLTDVPIMALTATAIPRVQVDICTNLALREPYLDRQSFDRDNLQITVLRKPSGSISSNLESLLEKLADEASTILYAPTRDQVEAICSYLRQKLPMIQVETYHAGMSQDERTKAHTSFLVGKTNIICATVAFGMGIDKPDTRRVVHYGSPKTMEEYYQQIGRAGRDGLPAECIMLVNDADFVRYDSDFYTGRLSTEAKAIFEQSLNALRTFAMDCKTCRRKSLLSFFEEVPKFGDYCGTCDVCRTRASHPGDFERDFGPIGAHLILTAVSCLREQSLSVVEKVISGKMVEPYRYCQNVNATQLQQSIIDAKTRITKNMPMLYYRELLASMTSKGYVIQRVKKVNFPGQTYSRSFSYYEVTTQGWEALRDRSMPIMLPVPQAVRDMERLVEERSQKSRSTLQSQHGTGDDARACTKWDSYLGSLAKAGKLDRVQHLEDLRQRIVAWRLDTAAKHRLAPSSVMSEHLLVLVAYSIASLRPGEKVEKESLINAGVQVKEVDSLVKTIHKWTDEIQPLSKNATKGTSSSLLIFDDAPFTPTKVWEYACYRPNKGTGLASWESSHSRFLAGEHPQTIAMTPENGRPIQVSTVVSHILQGLEHGRSVPLKRLATVVAAPTEEEWRELSRVEETTSMSVVGDPETSGIHGGKFSFTEFLSPIMGDNFVKTPYNLRTTDDNAKFSKWSNALRWYSALKRAGFEPTFKAVEGEGN